MKVNTDFASAYVELSNLIQEALKPLETDTRAEFNILVHQKVIAIYVRWDNGFSERLCEIYAPNYLNIESKLICIGDNNGGSLLNIPYNDVSKFSSFIKRKYNAFVKSMLNNPVR